MRRLLIICSILASVSLYAQRPVTQCGRVRSICYSRLGKVQPISNVIVKPYLQPEQRSDQNGNFCISVVPDKNGMFRYESIKSLGYTLISPNKEDLSRESFVVNSKEVKDIIMVKDGELYAERRRISNNIRKEKENEIANLQNKIIEKDAQLNKYIQENKDVAQLKTNISELERKYNELQANYENATKQIEEEADRLARIDYLNIDSINAYSFDLQKAGLWSKAVQYNKRYVSEKEIRQTALDFEAVIKRKDFEAERCAHIADSYAQGYERDSALFWLEQRIILDPNNVDFLYDAGRYALHGIGDKEKSESYLKRAYENSVEKYGNYNIRTANCLTMLGQLYTNKYADMRKESDYNVAVYYYKKAISCINQKEDLELSIIWNSNLGLIYLNKDYKEALACFRKSYEFHMQDTVKYRSQLATDNNNIGRTYTMLGKYHEAQKFLKEAIRISESSGMVELLGTSYTNIGEAYLLDKDDYKSIYRAKESFIKAIEYKKKVKSKDIYTEYFFLGKTYMHMRQWDNAIESYNKAKQESNLSTDGEALRVIASENEICSALIEKKDFSAALDQCKRTINELFEIKNMLSYGPISFSLKYLWQIYVNLGQLTEGKDHFNLIISTAKNGLIMEVNKQSFEIFALYYLGAMYLQSNNNSNAKDCFQKALKIIEVWNIDENIKREYKKEISQYIDQI